MTDLFDKPPLNSENIDPEFGHFFDPNPPAFVNMSEKRDIMNDLWHNFEHLADSNFKSRIRSNFHSCFFEMYMAKSLSLAGLPLKSDNSGPDIYIDTLNAWVECVIATKGVPGKPDSVPTPPPLDLSDPETHVAHDVPVSQILLRLSNAFDEKAKKYVKYMKEGKVLQSQPKIIAINGNQANFPPLDPGYPRILATLFPIGDEYITLDRATTDVVGSGYKYAPHVFKNNNSPVGKNYFVEEELKYITGVIYSSASIWNFPNKIGADLIYIPNPKAPVTVPANLLKVGMYYEVNESATHMNLTGRSFH